MTCASGSKAGASPTISSEEPVELIRVPTELEAVELCGLLAESGIEARSEAGGSDDWLDSLETGAHRVFVAPGDLDRARELLESR